MRVSTLVATRVRKCGWKTIVNTLNREIIEYLDYGKKLRKKGKN
jgi:hypothetical protein